MGANQGRCAPSYITDDHHRRLLTGDHLHHGLLIFVTKHFRGYEIMRDIMARESTRFPQSVPSFSYNPRDLTNPPLIELGKPLDELKRMLCRDLAGHRITMRQVYEHHSNGKLYMQLNFKEALRQLEAEGRLVATPSASDRRKVKGIVTFADEVIVEFP
jgi:hypothetical protein